MPAVPFKKTGTAPEDTPWSWDTDAIHAILGEKDDNWSAYKQAHAWWDGSTGQDAEKQAPYKLPHHRMGAHGLEAVWRGVVNAMARLKQSDIPEADMKSVFDHLTKHYAQWKKTPPEWQRFLADVREQRKQKQEPMRMNATRIPVLAVRAHGTPTPEDMRLINAQARTPLTPEDVYVIPAQISNQNVDAYFTRMDSSSLKNFGEDAKKGLALCDSHNHEQMPIGRSFYGECSPGAAGMTAQALAYMVRGMTLPGGMKSDDYIRGMETGLYQDVSVGFIPGAYQCSICGGDMLRDMECTHVPGVRYQTDDGEQQCIADVKDAHLAEFSLVYEGATPNAMLLKAERELEMGRLPARAMRFVEDTCRISLTPRYPTQARPEEDDMKGSELLLRIMARSGKEMSRGNMQKLQAIHDDLAAGHDDLASAIEKLGQFIVEKDDTNGDYGRVAKSGAKAKRTAKRKDIPDGTNPPPDDEDGDGEADEEDEASAEEGDDEDEDTERAADDEDSEDDHDPDDPNPPETDDGDGDDDAISGGRKKRKRSVSTKPFTRDQHRLIAIGLRAQEAAITTALAAGARALGAAFDETRYRKLLERSTYDEICQMRTDWQTLARRALSPIGHFEQNTDIPGGGYWTDEPTERGGRQTLARDPNNPLAFTTGRENIMPVRNVSDPRFYKTTKRK